MSEPRILSVLLHGKQVGTLTLLNDQRTLFVFDESYIENRPRSTLSLSFRDEYGELITDIDPTRVRVPPFFANLLPEGKLRGYLAERAGVNSKREFFLLGELGEDLPGAVQVRRLIDGAPVLPEDASPPRATKNGEPLRFSLAGVQLKFSAVMAARGGLTVPATGMGGNWILKLPSRFVDGLPENEYAMMTLAAWVGMDVPEARLVKLGEVQGLPSDVERLSDAGYAVRRFDRRDDGSTIHVEDFAQVYGIWPEDKYRRASYRSIAEALWRAVGESAIVEFTRRLAFNALIGNADMHLKNWSLIYPDGQQPALSPGYDFVSTIPYQGFDKKLALTLGKTKQMDKLDLDAFRYLAAKAGLPERPVIRAALETTEAFFDLWPRARAELPIAVSVAQAIEEHVTRIPFTRRGDTVASSRPNAVA